MTISCTKTNTIYLSKSDTYEQIRYTKLFSVTLSDSLQARIQKWLQGLLVRV